MPARGFISAAAALELAISRAAPGAGPVSFYVHTAAQTPTPLLRALAATLRGGGLARGATVSHLHLEGELPHLGAPGCVDVSYFVGANARAAVNVPDGAAEYVPIALSALPGHVRAAPPDVALLAVSPPCEHGWCSLGASVDASAAAAASARTRVGLVSSSVPRTGGADGLIHVSSLEALVDGAGFSPHAAAPHAAVPSRAAADAGIAERVAALIGDGDTLQVGIGAVPDGVLARLADRRGLNVHSEMISDGVMNLVESGAVRGAVTTSFAFGSAALYSWLHGNLGVVFRAADATNDPCRLRELNRLVSVNAALEIDLTGQVCSDSIGSRVFSGVGGSADFATGARASHGGRSIVALPARTVKGESRLVAALRPGAGVSITRAAVQWVVTEYGAALLAGKPLRARAAALIDIAHPDDRAALERAAHAAGLLRRETTA